MAKMTKAQAKRLVRDIESKTRKLYFQSTNTSMNDVVSIPDIVAIEKLCKKWMKRIG